MSYNLTIWSMVLLPLRKPACKLLSRLFFSKTYVNLFVARRSNALHMVLVKIIGHYDVGKDSSLLGFGKPRVLPRSRS